MAHLLSEVRSNKVRILCYCAPEVSERILSRGTLLEYFSFSDNFFSFTRDICMQIYVLCCRLLTLENMLVAFFIELELFDLRCAVRKDTFIYFVYLEGYCRDRETI